MELVKKFSEDMETMLRRKVEAVEVTLSLPQHWPGDPFRDSMTIDGLHLTGWGSCCLILTKSPQVSGETCHARKRTPLIPIQAL